MLELIRRYKALFSIVFLVAAAGLVISMFGSGASRGLGGAQGAGAVVAKVEGEEILVRQLLGAFNDQYEQMSKMFEQQGANTPQQREFLEQFIKAQVTPDAVLQKLIQQRFLVTTARSLGFQASKGSIQELIKEIPEFQKEGRFDPLLYRQMVKEPGLFEKGFRDQADFTALSRSIQAGLSVVSPNESATNQFLKAKRVFESLRVNPRKFPKPASVSKAEVEKFMAQPESQAKLKAYYDRNLQSFQKNEEIRALHILVSESEGGLAKIQSIQSEIKNKSLSFEEAAKKYSSDKSNASKGGDLGFFAKGVMDPEFEKAAFALASPGDISEPVKSSFGYHLIQLRERKPAESKSLEDVKAQIASVVLLEDLKAAQAQEWLARFKSASAPSESEIKSLGFKWTEEREWSPLDPALGTLGNVDQHVGQLLSLTKDQRVLPQPLPLADELVLIRFKEIKKDAQAEALMAQEGAEKAQENFQFFLEKRFESLEKAKKITREQKVLANLRQALSAGGR